MPVDYDGILEEIGELGPWQAKLFALLWLPSAPSAMAVFMYDFTAYVPAMRCLVPGCEGDDPEYEAFSNFTLPWDGDSVSECYRFVRKNISSPNSCVDSDFSKVSDTRPLGTLCIPGDRDLFQLGL